MGFEQLGLCTAVGFQALANATRIANSGFGYQALFNNTTGRFNNANGCQALYSNVDGRYNNAVGVQALYYNTSGESNNAVGDAALYSNTGSNNTAIGDSAGINLTTGNGNVCIGAGVAGVAAENGTIRIGDTTGGQSGNLACYIGGVYASGVDVNTAQSLYVDASGKLGTLLVDATGNKVTVPVPQGTEPQATFNEFLKQQKRIAELEGTVAHLAATLKEQTAQIQKVSTQLELSRSTPQQVVLKKSDL